MNPTYTPPRLTPPVTPTRSEVAAAHTNLAALSEHDISGRNAFLVGYLHSTLRALAEHVIDRAARANITRALALVEAHNELAEQEMAFFTPRTEPAPVDPRTVPHEGIACGRYAR